MTRARALKQVIRARAAKTGERYTDRSQTYSQRAERQATGAQGARHTPCTWRTSPAAPVAPAKGGLSDAKSIEKTGHDLAHWFAILDRFGGIEKGHTASAAFLYEQHKSPAGTARALSSPTNARAASA